MKMRSIDLWISSSSPDIGPHAINDENVLQYLKDFKFQPGLRLSKKKSDENALQYFFDFKVPGIQSERGCPYFAFDHDVQKAMKMCSIDIWISG